MLNDKTVSMVDACIDLFGNQRIRHVNTLCENTYLKSTHSISNVTIFYRAFYVKTGFDSVLLKIWMQT